MTGAPIMQIQEIFGKFICTLAEFSSRNRGNVSVMFAVAVIPMLAAVGVAVDYTRAVTARSAMQAAADSTALMLSQEAATTTTAQLSSDASANFAALFNHPEV